MSEIEAKSIENNETDCDNPISLDEIEKGLWLGTHFHLIKKSKCHHNFINSVHHSFFRWVYSSC